MTRTKQKLAFVEDDTQRRETYYKKLNSLKKKVSELTILCNIDACAIVYSPFDSTAEVWPNPSAVQQVIERFKSLPVHDQEKKMMDQESIVKERIEKLNEKLNKKYNENNKMEMNDLMIQSLADNELLQFLMPQNKQPLVDTINQKLVDVNRRIDDIKRDAIRQYQAAQMSKVPPKPPVGLAAPILQLGTPTPTVSHLLPDGRIGDPKLVEIKGLPGLYSQGGRLTLIQKP